MRLLLTLIVNGLFAAAVLAADLYQVEVIIFEQANAQAAQEEHYAAPSTLPSWHNARPLSYDGDANQTFSALPSSRHVLQGVGRELDRDPEYNVLVHTAWLQTGTSSRNAVPVYLSDGASGGSWYNAGHAIEGSVTFTHARYAHIDSELIYRHRGQDYYLQGSSRVDHNQLHYFDHPMFGMIVYIDPVD